MSKQTADIATTEKVGKQKNVRASYNRKFRCGCVATNGHPATVWSTRAVEGTCKRCGEEYWEIDKAGALIEMTVSDIENGTDAVRERMLHKEGYGYFERLTNLADRQEMLRNIEAMHAGDNTQYTYGTYQKEHRSYREGFRYWLAYNAVKTKPVQKDKLPKSEDQVKPAEPRVYSHTRAADIIDLYHTEGGCTTRKLAEMLGVAQSTLMGYIKKFEIDFNNRTHNQEE